MIAKRNPWRRIEILFDKRKSLHNKIWSIYREVLSITSPNCSIVKYYSKISNTFHQIKFQKSIMNRSYIKKAVLKNFAIFTEKHLSWCLFLYKYANLQSWNFIGKRLQHRCFPVNIAKFLRTPVLKNICVERRLNIFLHQQIT